MAKYKRAELTEEEEDSVQLDHLKTHVLPGGKSPGIWETRSLLEKFLLVFTTFLVFMVFIACILLAQTWNSLYLHINHQSEG